MYQKVIDKMTGKESKNIRRLSDNAFIPLDEGNRDYQEYLKWLEEGNTPLPADEPNEGTV